jgi:hypothetical protein
MGADPGRVVADRAQAEADLVIVRKSPIFAGHPLGLPIRARIGKISVPLAPVLSITSIDSGDDDIDGIFGRGSTARIGRG